MTLAKPVIEVFEDTHQQRALVEGATLFPSHLLSVSSLGLNQPFSSFSKGEKKNIYYW